MIGVALLALGASPLATQQQLVSEFEAICLRDRAPLQHIETSASHAGFQPVPALASSHEVHETKAWQKGPIRLFVLSGQSDPRWPLSPFCGVSGNVGKLPNQRELLEAVGTAASAPFSSGHGRGKNWAFTLPRTEGEGLVQILVNKDRPGSVRLMLLLQAPPVEEAAE